VGPFATLAGSLLLALSVAAPTTSQDLKTWFESEAASIMQPPRTAGSHAASAFSAGVSDVHLDDCTLSWSTKDGRRVNVALQAVDSDSLDVKSTVLLTGETVYYLAVTMRPGSPVVVHANEYTARMPGLSVLVRSPFDGNRLLKAMRQVVGLCQTSR
jgi:hypothetical protein